LGRKASVEVHRSRGKVGVFGEKNIEKNMRFARQKQVFLFWHNIGRWHIIGHPSVAIFYIE
jgi:hypothetical protein